MACLCEHAAPDMYSCASQHIALYAATMPGVIMHSLHGTLASSSHSTKLFFASCCIPGLAKCSIMASSSYITSFFFASDSILGLAKCNIVASSSHSFKLFFALSSTLGLANAVCCHVLAIRTFEHCTHVMYQQARCGNCLYRLLNHPCWLPSLLAILDSCYPHHRHLPSKVVQKMKYSSKFETASMR